MELLKVLLVSVVLLALGPLVLLASTVLLALGQRQRLQLLRAHAITALLALGLLLLDPVMSQFALIVLLEPIRQLVAHHHPIFV